MELWADTLQLRRRLLMQLSHEVRSTFQRKSIS